MIKGIGKRIQELRNERELTMDMLVADLNQRYEMEKPPSNKANDVYTPIVELLTYNVSCNKKRGTPTGASVLYHIYVQGIRYKEDGQDPGQFLQILCPQKVF